MDKKDFYAQERILLEKDNDLALEKRQMHDLKDAYEEEDYETKRLLSQLHEAYLQHKGSYHIEGIFDEWNREMRMNFAQIEEHQEDIKREERHIQEHLEEIMYEKQKLLIEEETTSEY